MKAGIRPVNNPSDVPVFDGIVMDVINMALEIAVITNDVLPEPVLQDSPLPFLGATRGKPLTPRNPSREPCLDVVPPT